MQQAIYTNTHIVRHTAQPGHGTGDALQHADVNADELTTFDLNSKPKRFRLLMSVVGNVFGGTILLSGMLMLPEIIVSLVIK